MANFLFNGVPLPALPEWDKTTYFYAYMYHGSGGDFFAIAKRRSEPWVDGEGVDVVAFYDLMLYKVSGSAWVFLSNRDSMMHSLKTTDIFWVNTDLYHTDGTLYLAASDPIPVGTAPQLDPLSLWLGWKAGNWVARQRGKEVVEEETDNGLGDSFPITFSLPDVLENPTFGYDSGNPCYYKISNMIPTADELAAVTIATEIIADEGSFSYDEIYIWSSTNDVGHLVANFGSVDYGFLEYYLAIPENSDGYEPGFYILNDGKGIWGIEDATIQITMSKSE